MDSFNLCAVLFLAMTPIALATIDFYHPRGFFPATNVSQLAWAHKVNTLTELTRALRDPHIRMIEGDVVMGHIPGRPTLTPIMGNPPVRENSFDLFDFMWEVRKHNRAAGTLGERKGIKLDFKEPKAFKEGIMWVYSLYNQTVDEYPVWLNGEILAGPVNASSDFLLNGKEFIELQQANFSISTLSLAWKAEFAVGGNYSMEHFNEMVNLLRETNPHAHITFSLRAQLALNSVENIKWFFDQSGMGAYSPSVTLIEEETDPRVGLEELEEFIKQIGANRVFVDLPHSFEDGLGERTTEKDWANETTEKESEPGYSSTEGGSGSGAGPIINNLVMAGLAILVSGSAFVR